MNEFFLNCVSDESKIGVGSFGWVKSGFYPDHGTIAFKIQMVEDNGYTENEINVLKAIRHQNIVQILGPLYERENDRTLVGYVMEKMETNLQEVIDNRNINYNDNKTFYWMEQVCSGLMFLHNVKNITHRDIKPSNILSGPGLMNLKLCDFGAARYASIGSQSFKGTIFYMSPEVMEAKGYTHSADIYSFGIMLWQIKTRRDPYGSMEESYRSINGYRPNIEDIDNLRTRKIIEQCWTQKPEDRPSAAELQQRFVQLIVEETDKWIDIVPAEVQERRIVEEHQQIEQQLQLEQVEKRKPFTTGRFLTAFRDSVENIARKSILEVERFRDRHSIPGSQND